MLKIKSILQGGNSEQTPSLKRGVLAAMAGWKKSFDLIWIQYKIS